jgi:hypothetical protein
MKCFLCGGETASKVTNLTARVQGKAVPVTVEATVCIRCDFAVLSDAQSDAYTAEGDLVYKEMYTFRKGG